MSRLRPWLVCALSSVVLGLAVAPSAEARSSHLSVAVPAVPAGVGVGKTLKVAGSITGKVAKGAKAQLQLKKKGHFRGVATSTIANKRFKLAWKSPHSSAKLTLRVAVVKGSKLLATGKSFTLSPRSLKGLPTGASGTTSVVPGQMVKSVPTPGQAGTLTLGANAAVSPGDVLAGGPGPNSPNGFLVMAKSVSSGGGTTTVHTVPATLPEAVPSGSFEKKLTTATLSRVQAAPGVHAQIVSGGRVKVRGLFSCGGSAPGIHVNGDVSVSVHVDAGADWSLFSSPHVTDAHLIATASATASVGVSADASAHCDLGPITLFKTDLGVIDIQVGPIPVVLTPVITVYLGANGTIQASVTTSAQGTLTAMAGLNYSNGNFSPVASFTPSFSFTPPSPAGTASLSATVSPTLDVLLYGVAGPQVQANVGLEADFATTDPVWTLSLPVSVTATLDIPILGIKSKQFTVYSHTFPLAQAQPTTPTGPTPPSGTVDFLHSTLPNGTAITNQFAGIGWINTEAANLFCANTQLGGPLCQEYANVPLHQYGGSFVNSDGTPGTVDHLSVTVDCTFYNSTPCLSTSGPANNIELVATLSDGTTRTVQATSDPDTLTVNANGIVSYVTQPIDGVSDYAYGVDTVTFSQ